MSNNTNIKILLVLVLCTMSIIFISAQDCTSPKAQIVLEGAKIKVSHSIGLLWLDTLNQDHFLYPKDRRVSALRQGSFWVGAKDSSGDVRVSSQYTMQYASGLSISPNWSAGPHHPKTSCEEWDKGFELKNHELLSFKKDLEDGVIDKNIPLSILAWPAIGNPYFEDIHGFELPSSPGGYANFLDVDQDGHYDPKKGDQPINHNASHSAWWIMNDQHNTYNEKPLGVEIQVTAHVYDGPRIALNNSIIYEVKLVNKSGDDLTDVAFSIRQTQGLGCAEDDYFGSSPQNNLVYHYNKDSLDGATGINCPGGIQTYGSEIPIIGIKLLKGFENELGKEIAMSSFMYFNHSVCDPPIKSFGPRPNNASIEYNFMTGSWADGSSLTFGGSGYWNSIPAKFVFPDPPNENEGWSMCEANLEWCLRNYLMNFGPFNLKAEEFNTMVFAVTGVEDVKHPCPEIDPLIERTNALKELWDRRLLSSNKNLNSSEEGALSIYPNPISINGSNVKTGILNLVLEMPYNFQEVEIFDLDLRIVKRLKSYQTNKMEINVHEFSTGIYFVKVICTEGKTFTKKLVLI